MHRFGDADHRVITLYADHNGYVVLCEPCKTFHIAFGTIAFDQTESSLLSLMRVLELHYVENQYDIKPNCRCVQITTPFDGFRLLFSLNEIEQFIEMLNQAYLVFDASRIANGQN